MKKKERIDLLERKLLALEITVNRMRRYHPEEAKLDEAVNEAAAKMHREVEQTVLGFTRTDQDAALRPKDDPHNWQEDFDQENGMYRNKCVVCSVVFVGNKHRSLCKVCQWPSLRYP